MPVVEAMKHFAELAEQGREAFLQGDVQRLAALIDENFDARRQIYTLPSWQVEMIEVARQCGASAKFAGSGGAIVGTYQGAEMLEKLREKMAQIDCRLMVPQISY